jgi:hypothetical protein
VRLFQSFSVSGVTGAPGARRRWDSRGSREPGLCPEPAGGRTGAQATAARRGADTIREVSPLKPPGRLRRFSTACLPSPLPDPRGRRRAKHFQALALKINFLAETIRRLRSATTIFGPSRVPRIVSCCGAINHLFSCILASCRPIVAPQSELIAAGPRTENWDLKGSARARCWHRSSLSRIYRNGT